MHDALCRAAQRERILRSRRAQSDAEKSGDSVDLVGERDDSAALRARQRIVDVLRQIVVVNGLPHFVGIAFFARVDAADLSLQIGELLHHLRDEIGLAELRGGVDVRMIGDRLRDGDDSVALLAIVAELLLKLQMRELLEPLFEFFLAIGLIEKLGVGKTRVRDERVAVRGVPFRIAIVVEHRQERIRERVAGSANGKLHAHHRDEHLFRQREIFALELGAHEARIFGQVLPLRPDRRVHRRRAAGLIGEHARAFRHHVTAARDVDDHARLFDRVHIIVVRLHIDLLRRECAMSDRCRS